MSLDQAACSSVWPRAAARGGVQGKYHWHKHDDDESLYVVSGRFLIDLEGRTVELSPGRGFVVTRGVMHRPRRRSAPSF